MNTAANRAIHLLSVICILLIAGNPTDVNAASVSVISDNQDISLRDITTDGTTLYLTGSVNSTAVRGILATPISGGPASVLYSFGASPQGIAHLGSTLIWGDSQSGPATDTQILTAPTSGAGPITAIYTGILVGQPIVDVFGLETDGSRIYTADAVSGRIHSMNLDGSGFTQIGPDRYAGGFGNAHMNFIALGPGEIFIGESTVETSDSPPSIPLIPGLQSHSTSTSAGAFTALVSGPPFVGDGPQGIAFGENSLFVTQDDQILVFSTTGVLLSTIPDLLFNDLGGITYHNGFLFVLDSFEGGSRILRIDLSETQEVAIDIKPGNENDIDPINLKSKGSLPVAVFSSVDFDATTIDVSTAALGDPLLNPATAGVLNSNIEDVDGDNLLDLMLFFGSGALVDGGAIDGNTIEVELTADIPDGQIIGTDTVRIVGGGNAKPVVGQKKVTWGEVKQRIE